MRVRLTVLISVAAAGIFVLGSPAVASPGPDMGWQSVATPAAPATGVAGQRQGNNGNS